MVLPLSGPVITVLGPTDPFWGQFSLCGGRFSPFRGVGLGVGGAAGPSPTRVPVSRPQELVVQKGWRLPEYTVTQESGPAHRKEFTMTCRVERFLEIGGGRRHGGVTVGVAQGGGVRGSPGLSPRPPPGAGSGTSKKLAKRNAAAKMLVRIHNVPTEPREGSEAEAEEEQFSLVAASEGLTGGEWGGGH